MSVGTAWGRVSVRTEWGVSVGTGWGHASLLTLSMGWTGYIWGSVCPKML